MSQCNWLGGSPRTWSREGAPWRTSARRGYLVDYQDREERRTRSEEPQGLVLRPNRECAKNDDGERDASVSPGWGDEHMGETYDEMRRRKDTMDEWFDEDSRPRGRPQLAPWQTEDARVPPHIGRCSGAEKVVPRKWPAAGPPAPSPCRNPITPMAWSCQRTDSDSSWTKLDEGSRKSPPRDAEGSQPGGSLLKKHRAADRRQAQNNNKRQAASKSQEMGRTWRGKRDMDDRISPDIVEREEKRMRALAQ